MTKTLNVYTNNAPKNKTIPNNAKICHRLGIDYFFKCNMLELYLSIKMK